MRRKGLFIFLIVLLCVFLLPACSDGRAEEASALVSGYYKAADASKISVMAIQPYGSGYLALAMYTADGSQLALFKIEKGADGKSIITAASDGSAAKGGLYSANMLTDNGKTVVFGDAGTATCNKIAVAFDDGTKVTAQIGEGKGYIAVADGEPKAQDFTLYGNGDAVAGSYQEMLNAGGSIVHTGFITVVSK